MKKKIFAIALAASIAVLAIAGTSMAYFTDTEEYTNVFTTGNVEIQMTEAAVKDDGVGNLVLDDTANRTIINDTPATKDYGKIFPSQTIYKDPTIENVGTEPAFVGAIIYIESTVFNSIVTPEDIDDFITGINNTAKVTYKQTTTGYEIYMIFEAPTAVNTKHVLFDGIQVFEEWDHDQMKNLSDLKITVKAYATQTAGFANATTALTTAFATKGWNAADLNAATTLPRNP